MQRDDKSTRYLVLKKERVFEVDFVAAVAPSVLGVTLSVQN